MREVMNQKIKNPSDTPPPVALLRHLQIDNLYSNNKDFLVGHCTYICTSMNLYLKQKIKLVHNYQLQG